MSKIFHWIRAFLPAFLILFFVLFAMVPTFYEWSLRWKIKPIRYFELVHNFPTDYELYLSKIRQGKEGSWLAKEKYTSEPHEGSLIQVLYVFIGKVSDWVHVQTPYVWFSYHVMRVFFAVVLLFVMWRVSEWVFPGFSWQIITFLLIVTASTWPKFETVDGWPRFGGYMPWYTVVDSMQRTTFLPHILFGQAMLAFILWVFGGGFITKKMPGNWVFLGVIGLLLGIVFTPALAFIYGVLAFWTLGEIFALIKDNWKDLSSGSGASLKKIAVRYFTNNLFGRIIFGVLSLPSIIYFAMISAQYPWKRLVEFDVLHPTKFSYIEYFLALGATLPLGLVGVVISCLDQLKPSSTRTVLQKKLPIFSYWIFSWLFFVFLFNYIPQQSPTRWTEMAPHIPLAIMSMYAIYTGYQYVKKWQSKTASKQDSVKGGSGFGEALLIIPIIVILLGCGTMFSSWLWQKDFVDHKLRADIPLVPQGAEVMYPLLDLVDAMVWLQVNTPRDVAVFSGQATGNLIPVYSGNFTYVGHANTVNSEMKVIIVANFFGRKRPPEEFLSLFKENNIQYVLYGPEEQGLAYGAPDLRPYYPFLTEMFRNPQVIVYKVNF